MKLAWATDIHLDCVSDVFEAVRRLKESSDRCESFVISGDISISPMLISHLQALDDILDVPVYFVLGNHDYYLSNIEMTRRKVSDACRNFTYVRYLGALQHIKLENRVSMVGSDGWYDGHNGNPFASQFVMNDWIKIENFLPAIKSTFGGKMIDKNVVLGIARELSASSASKVVSGIKSCINFSEHIIIVTHVPPFAQSCVSSKFEGADSREVTPWYTSKIMGDTILSAARAYPNKKFTVLSGHTHGNFEGNILNNLTVKVGKSEYGNPSVAGFIDI